MCSNTRLRFFRSRCGSAGPEKNAPELIEARASHLLRLKERREVVGDKTGRGSDLAPELERIRIGIVDRNVVRVGVGEGRKQKASRKHHHGD